MIKIKRHFIFLKSLKLLFFILNIFLLNIFHYKIIKETTNNNFYLILDNNKYDFPKYEQNLTNLTEIYFNISDLNYSFSFEFNVIKIIYEINFYVNNSLIKPSDLALNKQLHILCLLKEIKSDIMIDSIADIKGNKNFVCIEYSNIKRQIILGIKIYKIEDDIEYKNIYFFNNKIFNYNNLENKNNRIFNILIINNQYFNYLNKIEFNYNESKLKKSFYLPPYCCLKRDIAINDNQWYFSNIYNNYFCFCKDSLFIDIRNNQRCKYKLYLSIIDNNRYIYEKTDYLLSDFIIKNIEPVDGYPIFKEMIKQNLSAHYMTEDEIIYNDFFINNENHFSFFPIIFEKNINGDFLEKYLEILLKLRAVVAVDHFYSIDNLFYNIEYITYIFLGHGVSYFKQYLYNNYLSNKRFDKIVIPPSEVIISIAKKYGWKDTNIIKLGLPRWDYYNITGYNYYNFVLELNNNNCIFLMFTWRKVKKGKEISNFYLNNTFNLLNNEKLNMKLIEKNITIFYTYHHSLKGKKKLNLLKSKNIKIINQTQISEIIKKSNLIITDFSSIVFENFYRRKPFVLYIPDGNDPIIKSLYIKPYFDIINGLKNNSIYFENKFFDLEKAIDKIIFYINNNFIIDKKLNKFFSFFNFKFKGNNNTNNLINYLKQIN